jgi:hypothetical protein
LILMMNWDILGGNSQVSQSVVMQEVPWLDGGVDRNLSAGRRHTGRKVRLLTRPVGE